MGGSLAWPPVNCVSQPGQTAVPGDLFSGALSPELGWTSGTHLTGEGKTTWTGLCSVGDVSERGMKTYFLHQKVLSIPIPHGLVILGLGPLVCGRQYRLPIHSSILAC